jgi:hypothetical protein
MVRFGEKAHLFMINSPLTQALLFVQSSVANVNMNERNTLCERRLRYPHKGLIGS